MTRLLPLMLVLLAACHNPFEELYPAENHVFGRGDRVIDVRAQFDAFERGYFAHIRSRHDRLEPHDRPMVYEIFREDLGRKLCDGAPLELVAERVWTGHGQHTIRYLPVYGEYVLMGRCT